MKKKERKKQALAAEPRNPAGFKVRSALRTLGPLKGSMVPVPHWDSYQM